MQRAMIGKSFGLGRFAAVGLLFAVGLCWSACKSADGGPADAGTHAVHSDRLQLVMRQMDRLDGALLPQELDVGVELQRHRTNVARLAGEIADSAKSIPDALGGMELPPAEKQAFMDLTGALSANASALGNDAPSLGMSELRSRVGAMRESCNACHTRFRLKPVDGN